MTHNKKVTEEQIWEYIKCPTLYDTNFNKKIKATTKATLANSLMKLTNAFLLHLSNGRVLAMGELKRKWDMICEKDNINEQKCLEGLQQIANFYKWAEAKQLRILDVKMPYGLTIKGNTGATSITGEINCIAVTPDNKYELLYVDYGNKQPDQPYLDRKLKYSLDALAFKQMYGEDIYIHVHYVKGNLDFYSYRNRTDFERLTSTIDSVSECIDKNLYYPRENVFCTSCSIKQVCRAWSLVKAGDKY